MQTISIISASPEETSALGQKIAKHLKAGSILCLTGNLGSGKTTFVKGLAKGLGIDPVKVNSPTFVLMNVYEGKLPLYHFDFYRLEEQKEIANIGYDEFFYGEGVAVAEWAERLGESLRPKECLNITFEHRNENERAITISAQGKNYQTLVEKLKS